MMWKDCIVKTRKNGERVDKEAILVGVFQQSDVIPPSMMVGGHAGGQVGGPVAVVKMDDKLQRVQIQDVIIVPDTYGIAMKTTKAGDKLMEQLEREWAQKAMKEYIDKERRKWEPEYPTTKLSTYPVDTVGMIETYLKQQEEPEYTIEPKPDGMDQQLYNHAIRNKIPLTRIVYHDDIKFNREIQERQKERLRTPYYSGFNERMKMELNSWSGISQSKGGLE